MWRSSQKIDIKHYVIIASLVNGMGEYVHIKEMENELENQAENKQTKTARIQPYMWKKGQSGNPTGRPKGKTMKEYARELLQCQTEEERQEFLNGIPKVDIWKLAEGLPQQDITSGGEAIIPVPLINYVRDNNSNKQNTETIPENKDSAGGDISVKDSINTDLPNLTGPAGQNDNLN